MSIRFDTSHAPEWSELGINSDGVLVLHGEVIDDRGRIAVDAWGQSARKLLVKYDPDSMTIDVGQQSSGADSVAVLLREFVGYKVFLEATTLGFAELFALVSGLIELKTDKLEIVYVEPDSYKRTRPGADQFALSGPARGYKPIPRSIVDLGSDDIEAGVFFLGFEPERLDRAFEEYQMIANKEIKVVFGIPAYRAGWELDAIIPHLPRLLQNPLNIEYCSASDPEAAYECLERTRSSLGLGKRMFVAPIGTKPCGIAAAVFASAFPSQVGLLFDHPRRSPRRSDGAYVWHKYDVSFMLS